MPASDLLHEEGIRTRFTSMSELNVRQPSSEEITRRMVRKEQASQERYLNLERLAKATERLGHLMEDTNRAMWKLVSVLTPPDENPPAEAEKPVEVNDAGLPIPPWIDEPSTETVEYDKG